MAYQRITQNAQELSAACRRAALSRRHCRGGRPKKDNVPEGVVKVFGRDLEVFSAYARLRKCTIKTALNVLAHLIIFGGTVPARPELAPQSWRLIR